MVKFKYFRITEQATLDEIESCLQSSVKKEKFLAEISTEFGARKCLQYNGGSVAAFVFDKYPDRTIWKNVKHGFMPKVKTKENKRLCEAPKETSYKEVIKKYGLGGEMVLGEPKSNSRGVPMHSSYLRGCRKLGSYFVVVPYQGEFEKELDSSLKEVKEWEMLRDLETEEQAS